MNEWDVDYSKVGMTLIQANPHWSRQTFFPSLQPQKQPTITTNKWHDRIHDHASIWASFIFGKDGTELQGPPCPRYDFFISVYYLPHFDDVWISWQLLPRTCCNVTSIPYSHHICNCNEKSRWKGYMSYNNWMVSLFFGNHCNHNVWHLWMDSFHLGNHVIGSP